MAFALRPCAVSLIAAASLLAVGCGESSSDQASGGSANASPAGDSSSSGGRHGSSTERAAGSGRAKAVRFSACMREHGLDTFPDPDASGELTADGIANDGSIDTSSPAWDAALSACKDLQPSGFTGHQRTEGQQAAAVKFAQCIRENGVDDFPDPDPDGPLVDTNRIPSAAGKGGLEIPGLTEAMDTCGAIYADEIGLGER